MSRLHCGVLLASFLAVTAYTPVVCAQEAQDTQDRPGIEMRLGQLRLVPALAVKDFGVDGNVFNNGENRRDMTVTLAPQVETSMPFARHARVTTFLGTDLVYYQQYASERSVDPHVMVHGEVNLNRLTLFVEPEFQRTRQRLNYEVDARARRTQQGTAAGIRMQPREYLHLEGGASIQHLAFDADAVFDGTSLQETLNRRTRRTWGMLRQDLSPLTAVVLRAEAAKDTFDLSPNRNASSLEVTPGVELRPHALVSGTAYAGFKRFTPASPDVPEFRGVVAHASLAYTLADSTRFTVSGERDLNYSYERLQPYFVVHGYGVEAERRLVGHLDLTAGFVRDRNLYRDINVGGASTNTDPRIDIVRVLSTSVGYRVSPTVRAAIGVAYRDRRTTHAQYGDYGGFRLMALMNYGLQP